MRLTSGRLRILGYALLVTSAVLLATIALARPSFGRQMIGVVLALGVIAAFAIWLAQVLEERS